MPLVFSLPPNDEDLTPLCPMKPGSTMAAVQEPVRRQLDRVQTQLRDTFRTPVPILNKVGGHLLATQGKKFRPTLLLLVARMHGLLGADAVRCATVVEMVHAAALIHDDSVDRSATRRGAPTVNGLWTDEMAIIMGDYLYAQAMTILVEHKLDMAMAVMARVVTEMSFGEAMEFQYAHDLDVSEDRYIELIRAKTGSLMGASTEIGAALNGASADQKLRRRYRTFGEKIGIAFQIVDDLLDYQGDPAVTGKPVGSDLAEGKITLPLIAALRSGSEADRRKLRDLAGRKRWTPNQWERLKALIHKCGGFDYARARALEVAEEARRIPNGDAAARGRPAAPGVRAACRALDRAVDYAVERVS